MSPFGDEDLLPQPMPRMTSKPVCTVCDGDWVRHLALAPYYELDDDEQVDVDGYRGEPTLQTCIAVLKEAGRGPIGPQGPMGPAGPAAPLVRH